MEAGPKERISYPSSWEKGPGCEGVSFEAPEGL